MGRLRFWALIAAVAGMAGCAGEELDVEEAPEEVPLPDAFADGERLAFMDATIDWHDDGDPSPAGLFFRLYDPLTQPIAHPCAWDDGKEVYFNNLHLSHRVGHPPVPAGATAWDVTVSWGPDDYLGDHLVLAYRGPNETVYRESPRLGNGETMRVGLPEGAANGTDRMAPETDLWLCISDEATSDDVAPPFVGAVTIRMELLNT